MWARRGANLREATRANEGGSNKLQFHILTTPKMFDPENQDQTEMFDPGFQDQTCLNFRQ